MDLNPAHTPALRGALGTSDPMAPLLAFVSTAPDELNAMIRKARERLARAGDRKSRVAALTEVAFLLGHRHMRHTELRADIDESVDVLREAITLARTQPGPRVLAERLLAAALCARQRPGDLAEVMSLVGRLLTQREFDARKDGMLLTHLGTALLLESQLTANSTMLDEGIAFLEKVVDQLRGDRSLVGRVNADMAQFILAYALAGRYASRWSADQRDLTRATDLLAAVDVDELDRLIPGFEEIRKHVGDGMNMATSNVTGDNVDLASAPGTGRAASTGGVLGRQSEQLVEANSMLNNNEAYRDGDLRSIDEQIKRSQEELEGMPPDDTLRGSTLVILAQLFCTRFRNRQLADMADARSDLEDAQNYARAALELSQPHSVGDATRVLGMCLLDRFGLGHGTKADLDEAIRLMRRARAHDAEDSRKALATCCSLSEALMLRGSLEGGAFDDIEEAERLLVTFNERQPASSPLAPISKIRLAVLLQHRSALTGDTEDRLRTSLASRRSAEAAVDVGVLWAYDAAAAWAHWAWLYGDARDRADSHQLAVQHLSRMARAQMGRGHAELALRRVSAGLIARAALSLTVDERPEEAVVTTETGRAVLLSATLERDGVQLDETIPAELRLQFGQALDRLRAAETAAMELTDDHLVNAPDEAGT